MARLKVLMYSLRQAFGFADIYDYIILVMHNINSRGIREFFNSSLISNVFPYSLFGLVVVEFRTFRLCGCRHGTQCIPQENMKSAAGFLSVWFSLFARLFRPFSCPEARGSSYFPSEHTVYPPAFSVYVCETLFYCTLFTLFRCAKIAL